MPQCIIVINAREIHRAARHGKPEPILQSIRYFERVADKHQLDPASRRVGINQRTKLPQAL
ncbi:hypothetical protein GCM10017708_11890 [Arthrobacter citreus]